MQDRSDTGPFTVVPLWLLDALSEHGRAGSTAMCVYVTMGVWADYESGEAWPSHKTIGKRAGIGSGAVKSALDLLRQVGAITWAARYRDDGSPDTNLYTVKRCRPTSPLAEGEGSPSAEGEGWGLAETTNENHLNETHPNERANVSETTDLRFELVSAAASIMVQQKQERGEQIQSVSGLARHFAKHIDTQLGHEVDLLLDRMRRCEQDGQHVDVLAHAATLAHPADLSVTRRLVTVNPDPALTHPTDCPECDGTRYVDSTDPNNPGVLPCLGVASSEPMV